VLRRGWYFVEDERHRHGTANCSGLQRKRIRWANNAAMGVTRVLRDVHQESRSSQGTPVLCDRIIQTFNYVPNENVP
jgi:hypothetical protein